MESEKTYDISEVCRMLGITSRALRFYESKGLIQSTKYGISSRRKYTEKQLDNIKSVVTFRRLGLSIKTIQSLQKSNVNLKDAICSKRAEIYASINTKIHEINFLNEVLFSIDSGNADLLPNVQNIPDESENDLNTVRICSDAVLNGKTDVIYEYMSDRMKQYLPCSAYEKIREDMFLPLGTFLSMGRTSVDQNYPHKYIQHIRFSKLGLKITFVIYNNLIEGFWLGYYDTEKEK